MNNGIHGLWPAVLMPVSADGALDTPRALAHCKHLIAAGCNGVTVFGTTGEGPAFTNAERKSFLEALLEGGVGATQIVVTTTAASLGDAIDLGRHAAALGCHHQLYMPPFYFRDPTQAGIVEAVSTVVRGINDPDLKLLLYHIPALSSVAFSHESIQMLVDRHPGQVIGAKDSSGDLAHGLALTKGFPTLCILVGAEQYIGAVMQVGGSGSINGLGNISPGLLSRIVATPSQVSPADEKLVLDLLALLSAKPNLNFVSVYKAMLAEQTGDDVWLNVRPPLMPLEATELQAVRKAYRALGADALKTL